ncbi:MAG TPA: acyl-CoA dehydrogenase family protein, partial [Candidatus Saccharimonadales bacterium]|nr:acyl-CoA dehydrogenase family protein [Candidatus Saccharimonadales bacterium]
MDLRYRDDQLAVRDAVREFVRDRIVPRAADWSEGGAFPMPLLPELAAVGLTGLTVPTEYGGSGVDALTSALVSEELGAGDGSIALTLAAHNALCIGHLLTAATAEQKSRWLPPLAKGTYLGAWALTEPSAGSDAVAAKTTARQDGDGWVLDGQKQFITNGSIAGFTVVIAATADRRLTAFGVSADNPGLRAGKREKKMGLGASDTAQLSLQDCRVSDADRIGEIGGAFGDVRRVLDRGRIGIGALAVGLGRAALETAVAYAKERTQFGKALAEFQMIQWRLAQSRTELDAGRLLIHRAASLADAGLPF